MQARDPLEERLRTRRAPGNVDVDGDDPIDALQGGVVVEHPARRRAGAHRDHPFGLQHLVIDLPERARHLVRHAARDDHQIGLARRGAEELHAEARDVVARADDGHHLDRAAREAEQIGPHRVRVRPRPQLPEGRQAELPFERRDLVLEDAGALVRPRPEQPLRSETVA